MGTPEQEQETSPGPGMVMGTLEQGTARVLAG